MPKAHPLFVTSLTFLPPRDQHFHHHDGSSDNSVGSTSKLRLLPPHYELVSSSADRVIRWHRGPSLERLALLDANQRSRSGFCSSVFSLLIVLALPLFLPFLFAILLTSFPSPLP